MILPVQTGPFWPRHNALSRARLPKIWNARATIQRGTTGQTPARRTPFIHSKFSPDSSPDRPTRRNKTPPQNLPAATIMIRFDHTRLRVADLDASIAFYQKLGFEEGERKDSPQGNRLAFCTLPGQSHKLELCQNPDGPPQVPEDLVHTCVRVPDLIAYCQRVEDLGIEIWPENWHAKFSAGERKMAFVTDPDGYEVEILEYA